ncbi:MAG: hypothetical protein ACP5XB_03135 [Isosphaeraceae bacterium]
MPFSTLLMLLALAGPADAAGLVFSPPPLINLYTEPGAELTLRLRRTSGDATAPVAFRVLDYAGKLVTEGRPRSLGGDEWELTFKLVQGFFEIEIPASRQRFGVVCLPAWKGKPDPFFAIDGGLSWLVSEPSRREQLIEAARGCGVAMIRERLSWSAVNPGQDRWNLEGRPRYDSLRQFYRQSGLPILELAHDSPGWLGHVRKYPHDLAATASSWAGLGRKWAAAWGALETWNEPDIDFGGNLPADQYAAVSKAIGFGLAQAGIHTPIVGGVMATPNRAYLDTCAACGLLDRVDVFSFHNYGGAEAMQALAEGYRQWLTQSGHGAMPLWITECGRPWTRGPDRPPVPQDQRSAQDIIMKGVEARACGIACYFPFVYPYYDENNSNFGMTDRRGTPLRSFAAYAQMIRVLGNEHFLGDLRHQPPGVVRARVFGDDHQTFAVLYTRDRKADATVTLGLHARRIEGIDGRLLKAGKGGAVPIPDGLTYVWLDHPLDSGLIDRSAAARARPAEGTREAARPAPSPIVLRLRLDEARLQPSARGYRIKEQPAGSLPLAFEVWNLGDKRCTTTVGLTFESLGAQAPELEQPLTLAARSSSVAEWTVDAGAMLSRQGRLSLRLTARDGSVVQDKLAIVLLGEPDLKQTLAHAVRPLALPIGEIKRWTPNHSAHQTVTLDSTGDAAWRLRVAKGQGGDRWVYPKLLLPEAVHLNRSSGLIVRGRCSARAQARILVWEGDVKSNIVYMTPDPVIPADGQWHVARVSFRDLVPSTANAPDPDGHLDPARVRHLSVGMNPRAGECTLEISDLYVIGEP